MNNQNIQQNTNRKLIKKSSKTPKNEDKDCESINYLNTEEVLKLIQDPRKWKQNDILLKQNILSMTTTRSEVIKLSTDLNNSLNQYNVRELGICPIRHELYSQCFNEIIRQTTLSCAEQGYILIKIRNESNMSIENYQRLFESINSYVIRKELLKKQKEQDLITKVKLIEEKKDLLESKLRDVIAATVQYEHESAETRDLENKKHAEQLEALENVNRQLKAKLLKSILSPTE